MDIAETGERERLLSTGENRVNCPFEIQRNNKLSTFTADYYSVGNLTELRQAIEEGDIISVKAVLRELNNDQLLEILQERNLQGQDIFRRTAIGYHMTAKQTNVIKAILEHIVNATDGDDKLLKAAFPFTGWINDEILAEKILEKWNAETYELLSSVTEKKATFLHCFPSSRMVKFFIDQCEKYSRPPSSCECGHHSIVDEIILMTDEDGDNALHVACVMGNTEAVKVILNIEKTKKKLLLARNTNGFTAYNRAERQGHTETVNFLLEKLTSYCNEDEIKLIKSSVDKGLRKRFINSCQEGKTEEALEILDKVEDDKLQQILFGSKALDNALEMNQLETLEKIIDYTTIKRNSKHVCKALFPYLGVTQSRTRLEERIKTIVDKVNPFGVDNSFRKTIQSDLHQVTIHGETILSIACRVSTAEVVSYIIGQVKELPKDKFGEIVLKANDTANTILHAAWLNKQGQITETLEALLSKSLMDKLKKQPLGYRVHVEFLKYLYAKTEHKTFDEEDQISNDYLWTIMKKHIDELLWHALWGRTINDLKVLPEEHAKVRSNIIFTVLEKCKDDIDLLQQVFPYSPALIVEDTAKFENIFESKSDETKRSLLNVKSKSAKLTTLSTACKMGNVKAAEYLLTVMKDLEVIDVVMDQKDRRGYTAWDHALKCKSFDIAKLLLKYIKPLRADVRDKMVGVFMEWCEKGDTEAVKGLAALLPQEARENLIFLEKGEENHNRRIAFDLVVKNRHYRTLAEIISPNYTYSVSTMRKLLTEQREAILEVCMHGGHDALLNILTVTKTVDEASYKLNKYHCHSLLLDLMQTTDLNGRTLLHLACMRGALKLVAKILEYIPYAVCDHWLHNSSAADIICKPDNDKQTALHELCRLGDTHILQNLLDAAQKENCLQRLLKCQDYRKRTALYKVLEYGQFMQCKIMLDFALMAGCVNEVLALPNIEGQTIFHQICFQDKENTKRNMRLAISFAEKSRDHAQLKDIVRQKDRLGNYFYSYITEASNEVLKLLMEVDVNGECLKEYLTPVGNDRGVLHKVCQEDDHEQLEAIYTCFRLLKLELELKQEEQNLENFTDENLKKFEEVLFLKDAEGQTALHWACQGGNSECVRLILQIAAIVGCRRDLMVENDKKKRTCLHYSCFEGNSENVRTILDMAKKERNIHELLADKDDKVRTCMFYIKNSGPILLKHLVQEITDCDKYVDPTDPTDLLTYKMLANKDIRNKTMLQYLNYYGQSDTLKYGGLFTPFYTKIRDKEKVRRLVAEAENEKATQQEIEDIVVDNSDIEDYKLFSRWKKGDTYEENKSASLLTIIGKANCLELIDHQYTRCYLRQAWRKHGAFFYYSNLLIYSIFLFALTSFVSSHNTSNKYIQNVTDESPQDVKIANIPVFSQGCQILLFIFTILLLIWEILQHMSKRRSYWKAAENWCDIILIIGSLDLVISSWITGYLVWYHVKGAVLCMIAFIRAAWMLTRIPKSVHPLLEKLGLRFLMMFRVIGNICRFLPVFTIFILAFTLGFCNLLHRQTEYLHFGTAVMKTLAMTIGEVEVADTFINFDETQTLYMVPACILFVIFIGVMTISAMNLLIGMAIGDIKELSQNSEAKSFLILADIIFEGQAMDAQLDGWKHTQKIKSLFVETTHKGKHGIGDFVRNCTAKWRNVLIAILITVLMLTAIFPHVYFSLD